MKTAIAKGLFASHPYLEYRKLVADLLLQGKSTGNEQSEDLTHYSSLNQTRMNRLDKTMEIEPQNALELKSLKGEYIWLVLSEGWCGDAAQLLPVLHKMVLESDTIDLRIVLRDENQALMNLFLTNNSQSIPIVIIVNKKTGELLGHWGPRAQGAMELIQDYKNQFGIIDETAKTNLQLWYLQDKGLSTQKELLALMKQFDS